MKIFIISIWPSECLKVNNSTRETNILQDEHGYGALCQRLLDIDRHAEGVTHKHEDAEFVASDPYCGPNLCFLLSFLENV